MRIEDSKENKTHCLYYNEAEGMLKLQCDTEAVDGND